ncbi:MAG: recombinase family protein [Candidatus Acidiferrum sp.]
MASGILQQPTRTAIYARVSTTNHGQDVKLQTGELEQFVQARGWHLVDSYLDLGISGNKDKRPQLDRLMADAHKRRFDAVIVWRFDRFARSVSHLLRALETFNALGVAFVSLSENVDTTTPTGKMIFTVLGAVAELERSLIVERVRAGMRNAKAKGKAIGRPKVNVNTTQIARLRDSGASWRAIAKTTGLSIGTVYAARSKRPSGNEALSD